MSLHVVSAFAGVAGIDLAAEHAGMSTRLLCEKDKPCRSVLAARFPDAVIHEDVRTLTTDDLRASGAVPGRTVLTAGWPCQGNSVAGRRGGMGDPRSGLWSEVARLLGEFRPAWFLGENVPGLLSVNDGRDFATVLHDLADLRYGFCWRVLDARYFGVPQRRRRVILVGRLGDTGAASAEVLFEPEGVRGDSATRGEARPSAASRARESTAVSGYDIYNDALTGDVAHTLMSVGGRNNRLPHVVAMPSIAYTADHVSALLGGGERGYRIGAEEAAGGQLVAVHENQRGEVTVSDDLSSLSVGGGKPGQGYPAITDGVIVRRLTPLECERLQGFPDGWTAIPGASDSQRYRQMGNSVAVPVLEWVLRRLAAVDALACAA